VESSAAQVIKPVLEISRRTLVVGGMATIASLALVVGASTPAFAETYYGACTS
jgi:hypothetical protein